MVGHIADVERLWNYRILYIARGDAREFSGTTGRFCPEFSLQPSSVTEALRIIAVRQSTITLVGSLTEEARFARARSTPALRPGAAYVIAGHELHHLNILRINI